MPIKACNKARCEWGRMRVLKRKTYKIFFALLCLGAIVCAYIGGYVLYRDRLIETICQYEQIGDWELKSDLAKVEYIRDFVYANLEFVDDDSLRPDLMKEIFYSAKPFYVKLYELAQPENHFPAGYCGGMSLYLSSVYNLLGYKSVLLDMAYFDDDNRPIQSHVVTLVEVSGNWIVEDATFNVSYVDNGGEHIGIYDLIEMVKFGKTSSIHTVAGRSIFKDIYSEDEKLRIPCRVNTNNGLNISEGWKYSANMKPDFYFTEKDYDRFEHDGVRREPVSIFAYPYDIYYPRNALFNIRSDKRSLKELLFGKYTVGMK